MTIHFEDLSCSGSGLVAGGPLAQVEVPRDARLGWLIFPDCQEIQAWKGRVVGPPRGNHSVRLHVHNKVNVTHITIGVICDYILHPFSVEKVFETYVAALCRSALSLVKV